MASWAKIKFFWDTMLGSIGSSLTVTSTESVGDYSVDYIHNWLEVGSWKSANQTTPMYITYDGGVGNSSSADYLAILGHNLNSVGASVTLENSNDNFATDISTVAVISPASDKVAFIEFPIVVNGSFDLWSSGTGSVPDGWSILGGGATITRDNADYKTGRFSAQVGRNGSNVNLSSSVSDYEFYKGKTVTVGCWVKSSVSNQADIAINDGVTGWSTSSMHSGGGGWEFLTVTHTLDANATKFESRLRVLTFDGTVNFDGVIAKEGAGVLTADTSDFINPLSNSKRYWRLKISGTLTDKPYMSICVWGNKTELDFVSSSFDPHSVNINANVAISSSGYITGVHERFAQRNLNLNFSGVDSSLYNKIKSWHDTVGLRNFFMAWDSISNSDDVFLVRSGKVFNNHFDETGVYRDVTIELKGRRE